MASRAPRRMNAPERVRAKRAVPAGICVLALLFGMLWPATPMPPAWARAAAAWPSKAAPARTAFQAWPSPSSYCTGGSAPVERQTIPGHSEREGRLSCPICQLAHGWSGQPQLDAQLLTPLYLPLWVAALPPPVWQPHTSPRTIQRPRAPPWAA